MKLLLEYELIVEGEMEKFSVRTTKRCEMVDITAYINNILAQKGYFDGILTVFTPHTTSGITVNENADPDVQADITEYLQKLIPFESGFKHAEGNSDAHLKSSLVGCSESFIVENYKCVLGIWQAIYFCEFDGARVRDIFVKFIPSR